MSTMQKNESQLDTLLDNSCDSHTVLNEFTNGNLSIPMLLNIQERNSLKFIKGLTLIQKAFASNDDVEATAHFLSHFAANSSVFIVAVSTLVGKKLTGQLENDFLETVLDILHILNQKLPTVSLNILEVLLPQLNNVYEASGENQSNSQKLRELEQQKDDFAKALQKADTPQKVKPPSSFRLLPKIPSNEELLSNEKPFLRPLVINGPYDDTEEYLDTHYRLLREDIFRNFRKGLSDYHLNESIENGNLYSNVYFGKVEYTLAGKLFHFVVPTVKELHWKTTKHLNPGHLLCLSCDGFKTFQFASIHSRNDNGHIGEVCSLALLFDEFNEPKDFPYFFEIIDVGVFYESCRYTLENIKQLNVDNFPFGNSLIDFQDCDQKPFELNEEQETRIAQFKQEINDENQGAAFELALRNRISLIQGPPGTGKSYLGSQIARFIIEEINRQSSNVISFGFKHHRKPPLILICFTNHALDQFLEKMLNYTEKIIRIGERSKSNVLKAHNLRYLKNSVYNTWKNVRESERFIVEEEADRIAENMNCMKSLGRDFNRQYAMLKQTIDYLNRESLSCAENIAYPFKKETTDVALNDVYFLNKINISHGVKENILHTLKNSLKFIKIYEWLMIDSSFSGIYEKMVDFRNILAEELELFIELNKKKIEKEDKTDDNQDQNSIQSLAKLLINLCIHNKRFGEFAEVQSIIRKHLCQNKDIFPLFLRSAVRYTNQNKVRIRNNCKSFWELGLFERWKLLSIVLEAAVKIRMEEFDYSGDSVAADVEIFGIMSDQKNVNDILQYADIIGMTITGAAKNFDMLRKLNPTTYIVEEAAEVLESDIVAGLAPNIKHLIMIGDHFQLRPTTNEYELSTKYYLDVSLFERLFKNGAPSKCLKMQHRMRPSIAHLLVPEFYSSLENHSSVMEYEDVAGVSNNVFFLQHSEIENDEDETKSHSNLFEACFVTNFCEYLISQGHDPSSVTILTTYIGQLRLIKKCMQKKNELKNVLATTVDNYQGEENDIILLSFVRSNADNKVGFIKTANRICVALSRARKGLYCFGDFKMFAKSSKIWQSLINKLNTMNSFGDSMNIHCYKHPEITNPVVIKTPIDLKHHIKRGCQQVCNENLLCAHTCDLFCHNQNNQHKSSQCNWNCFKNQEIITENEVKRKDPNKYEVQEKDPNKYEVKEKDPNEYDDKKKDHNEYEANRKNTNEYENKRNDPNEYEEKEQDHNEYEVKKKFTNELSSLDQSNGQYTHQDITNQDLDSENNNKKLSVKDSSTKTSGLKMIDHVKYINNVEKEVQFFQTSNEHENEEMSSLLPCGHKILVKEIRKKLNYTCKEITTSFFKCGQSKTHTCGENPYHENCTSPLVLQCGHWTSCSTTLDSYKCEQIMNKVLPCGHNMSLTCHETKTADLKCRALLDLKLPCGHLNYVPCFKTRNLSSVKCETPCGFLFECNHKCDKLCHDWCNLFMHGMCSTSIRKQLPCGHISMQKCYELENNNDKCGELVITTLPCGHTEEVRCSEKNDLNKIKCKKICMSDLNCGHKCSGICYSCLVLKEHKACQVPVTRTLRCGHITETTCSSDLSLLLCHQRCRYRCGHSQCLNPCYIKCFPCQEPCTWICDHQRCDKLCYEICEREPCNESCPKRYDNCDHLCPGFCGEPCPKVCPQCEGWDIPIQRSVWLEDCNHFFPPDELSNHLQNDKTKNLPKCPKCFTLITRNVRFGNFLKSLDKTQQDIVYQDDESSDSNFELSL